MTVLPVSSVKLYFFFNDTATTEIYTLSLHDALPILVASSRTSGQVSSSRSASSAQASARCSQLSSTSSRSEEHTSELQSRQYLVCRLLLEKKNHRLYSLPGRVQERCEGGSLVVGAHP